MFIILELAFTIIMQKLKRLHAKKLDAFSLYLGEVKQLRLSGWKGFKLYLQDRKGIKSELPVIKGIYSVGGKDGIKSWMDLEYREELEFLNGKNHSVSFSLSSSDLNRKLFRFLGNIIPPGGHLMVSYEGEQRIHAATTKSLSLGIPPVVTPLGILIFLGGFQYIKDWYLAEGGHEGPRKLWGEKAPDAKWAQVFNKRTARQIKQFFEEKADSLPKELEEQSRRRSREILEVISRI